MRRDNAHAEAIRAAFGGGDCSLVNIISIFLAATAQVEAHAFVRDVQPGAGSTVQTSPDKVRIRFTENTEPAFKSLTLLEKKWTNGMCIWIALTKNSCTFPCLRSKRESTKSSGASFQLIRM